MSLPLIVLAVCVCALPLAIVAVLLFLAAYAAGIDSGHNRKWE